MKYKESFYNIKVKDFLGSKDIEDDLVYNTKTGKLKIIPKTIINYPPKNLIQKGFFVTFGVNEAEEYYQTQINAMQDDYPARVCIIVCPSTKCNYRCEYCFEGTHEHGVDMKGEVLKDTIAYIKNEIDRNPNLKALEIRWFGGEPLLNMPAIREISEFVIPYCSIKDIKYSSSIVTNGLFFTEEISEELKNYKVKFAQIALDGMDDNYSSIRKAPQNAFCQILQNIEDSYIPVTIRVNTYQKNINSIGEIINRINCLDSVKKGKNHFFVARVNDYSYPLKYGFTDDEWLSFCEHRKDYTTKFPINNVPFSARFLPCSHNQIRNVILSADGLIYRCDYHINNTQLAIGTIKDGIKNGNSIDKDFIKSTITDECLKCKLLPFCGGGLCRLEELLYGKRCELMKARFRQDMELYIENFHKKKIHSRLPIKD